MKYASSPPQISAPNPNGLRGDTIEEKVREESILPTIIAEK